MWWPWIGRRGLRLHRQETSHGAARRNYGILIHNTGTGLSSPGFVILARFDGKLRTWGREGRSGDHPQEKLPVHECGSKSPVELRTRRGAKGTGAAIPGTRDREAGPPPIHRHGASDQVSAPERKEDDTEVGDDKSPQWQPEGAARTEPSDRELRGTPWASARSERGGVSPSGFPLQVMD